MNVTSKGHRLVVMVAMCLTGITLVALGAQNVALRRSLSLSLASRKQASASASVKVGDSLRPVTFITHSGGVTNGGALAKAPTTVFAFYRAGCLSCDADWPAWQRVIDGGAYADVVFVNCEVASRGTVPPLELTNQVTVDLSGAAQDVSRIGSVPLILTADSCGVVLSVHRSAAELLVASK